VYPTASRYWQCVEKHKLTQFYSAPTAIRLLRRMGSHHVEGYDLSSLRILGSVGEPINPEAWNWYNEHVGKRQCAIVDTWWLVLSFALRNTELGIDVLIAGRPKPGLLSSHLSLELSRRSLALRPCHSSVMSPPSWIPPQARCEPPYTISHINLSNVFSYRNWKATTLKASSP
jgi:hypothetical protein